MTEAFLHYVWKFGLFNRQELETTAGEPVQVIKAGELNRDAGPDFSDARIRLGETLWAGNVEIHVHSSLWEKHGHSGDKAYENVILHVVFEDDAPQNAVNTGIPVLVLKGRLRGEAWRNYQNLQSSGFGIPCASSLDRVDVFSMDIWLHRMLVERLESKSEQIIASLKLNRNNWEETFYHFLARNFGFKVNAIPFELMAKSLPLSCIARHKGSLLQVEALVFGQAGLLSADFTEEYPRALKAEYEFLRSKFRLKEINSGLWKFLRMRPVNFPTVRLAQFAMLMHKSDHLFSVMLGCPDPGELKKLFATGASPYWDTHFLPDRPSVELSKKLGAGSLDNILVNTVSPFLFVYGMMKDMPVYKERAVELLEQLDPESNSVIRSWAQTGVHARSAFDSQALLQLRNNYCTARRCLDCSIGNKIISAG